jgi:hypothetical protein
MFSDNYFNLLPGEKKTVLASNRKGTAISAACISVKALNAAKDRSAAE